MLSKCKTCLFLFLSTTFFICCQNKYKEQVVSFPEFEADNHWSLRLPSNIYKTSLKDKLYQQVFEFSNDSMIMKLSLDSISHDEALLNFKAAIKNVKENTTGGPCLGGFEGYAKFYNFLDSSNGLSGLILDLEDKGKKIVWFRVEKVQTGKALILGFESLSSEKRNLVHEIVKSVRYKL